MTDKIEVTFKCLSCGADPIVLTTDDDPATDDSIVSCKSCGHEFGRYGDVKSKARQLAADTLRDRLRKSFKGLKGWKVK